jgi:hypothetical protein
MSVSQVVISLSSHNISSILIQYPNPAPRITTTAIATPTPIATAESIFGGLISRTTVGNKEAMTLFVVLQLKKSLSGRDRGLARL